MPASPSTRDVFVSKFNRGLAIALWLIVALLFGASVLAIGFCWKEGGLDREILRALRTPFFLWILGSAFVLFFGFLHGGYHNPIPMSALRFSGQLPSDMRENASSPP